MTGIIHAGASVAKADCRWGFFFCRVSDLRGVAFGGILGLTGEDFGVEVEVFCLEGRALLRVPAGRALSRYL